MLSDVEVKYSVASVPELHTVACRGHRRRTPPIWHQCCLKVGGGRCNGLIYCCGECHLGSAKRLDDPTNVLNLVVK
jgi:hypothetical protein